MSEIIARRSFTPLYIYLDIAFLIVLCFLLLRSKRYMAVIVGAVMGVVYMLVDYGIFHLATGSRSISEGYSLFWVLLWMSISYGFTNFAWIWLWFDQDKHLLEWSFTIVAWWFVCPHLSSILAGEQELITIQRTTSAYHGWMAAIWFVSYLALVIYNMRQKDRSKDQYHQTLCDWYCRAIFLGDGAFIRRYPKRGFHSGAQVLDLSRELLA